MERSQRSAGVNSTRTDQHNETCRKYINRARGRDCVWMCIYISLLPWLPDIIKVNYKGTVYYKGSSCPSPVYADQWREVTVNL